MMSILLCVILVAVGWAVFKLYRERPKINMLVLVNGTEMPFKLRLKPLGHCQEDYAAHCFWKSMFQVRWSPSNHSPTLAVRCMKTLLFLLYYAALLSLSARQAEPVDFKAWSGWWVYNDRQDNGDVKKTQYVMPIYYIDTSVLLENIPLVKFIKTTSGTRVVYFP